VGDAVLLGVVDLICQNVRRVDFVGRLGSDEFVVCMPASPLSDGRLVAQRLRRAIAGQAFETPLGPVRTRCIVGVAAAERRETDLWAVITRAAAVREELTPSATG